jgi:sulfite exporter TauE/SafE
VIGDPLRAAFLLSLLGLGTIPTLFAYGTALGTLSAGRRRSLHRVLGAAFLVLGYLPLAHGLMLVGIHLPHPMIPVYQPLG